MTTEIVPRAVRPKPLPPQGKPWARAGLHLLCIYAVAGLWLLRMATNMAGGLDEGRDRMVDAGMAPYLENVEQNVAVDPVTSEVAEIGALNYDLAMALQDNWFYDNSVDERRTICERFQANPAEVWTILVRDNGFADTPENKATMENTYSEVCVAFA